MIYKRTKFMEMERTLLEAWGKFVCGEASTTPNLDQDP